MFYALKLSGKEIQGKKPQGGKDREWKTREPSAGDCSVTCSVICLETWMLWTFCVSWQYDTVCDYEFEMWIIDSSTYWSRDAPTV